MNHFRHELVDYLFTALSSYFGLAMRDCSFSNQPTVTAIKAKISAISSIAKTTFLAA
jgi:hypothetical protein